MNRRQLLTIAGIGGIVAVGYRLLGGSGMVARGVSWPRVTPAITPPGQHYQVSKNVLFPDPAVEADGWRLDVYGLVGRRTSFTLADIERMPAVEMAATLACIGNGVPARAVGTARWTGVRLADILALAGGGARLAADVVFVCADNYTDSIPLAKALESGTMLAYRMNGEPLPRGHGFPLRAVVPGIYGMKNVKWIEGIELVSGDYRGYWQQRGWSEAAPYQTISRIDRPRAGEETAARRAIEIGGMAFAGDRGIDAVEVRITGAPGTTRSADDAWRRVALEPALGASTWRLWQTTWTPPAPGRYTIVVRATDGTGTTQVEARMKAFPNGATGWHAVEIEAV